MAITPEQFDSIIKNGGPASGAFLLFVAGDYGGQYAKEFEVPLDRAASVICIVAMVIGGFVAALLVVVTAFKEIFG